ncbi:MAG: tyrosine-type recombinase/integrase [Candidatus Acidiferrales bacterium]
MSRRSGQNPAVRVGKRADGTKYYFFQYWTDVPGQEERQRQTEVIGLVSQMTKSEAERQKLDFISKLQINSNDYQVPSSRTFADAVRHYREVFAPRMLRESTVLAAGHYIRKHLEADWNDVPIEHINIDSVNEWMWKKRQQGLSWVTIKNILRTMQRVLSCSSKDKKPPFSQEGLAIPERDKLQMKRDSRRKPAFSWEQAKWIAAQVRKMDSLKDRRERYAVLFTLQSASGLRPEEILALKMNDLDFKAGRIRVDEAVCERTGEIGECKNARAYRTVILADVEGREAMRELKEFLGDRIHNADTLVFPSKLGTPLRQTNVLHEVLHPALKALGLPKAGMRAFRRGCNRRWEVAGINPAVVRQQMGHSSAAMTELYTGEIPLAQVHAAFSIRSGSQIDVLENMENEAVA